MLHNMKLQDDPFTKIKNGTKTIELRLNDEKRRNIKVEDQIEFSNVKTNEKIIVDVLNLHYFKSFEELYHKFDKELIGYDVDEIANPEDMKKYYSEYDINKYGVLGIEIKKLKNNN